MLDKLRRLFSTSVFKERETRRRAVLEKIVSLGKSVAEVSDLKTTLVRIWHGVHDDLEFDRTAIFLYSPERNSIDGTFGTNLQGEMVETWEYSRSLAQTELTPLLRVLERPDGLYFTHNFDVENHVIKGHEMYGVKDYIAVAAWAGNKPVAILCGDNVISQRPIADEQIEMLRLYSGYAGLAIQNAKLYAEIQQELHERKLNEERYRAVVENQTEFIVRWKPDGMRTFVNDAYCRYYGLTAENAVSTSFFPLIIDTDRSAMDERISRLLSGVVNTETYIDQVIKHDGSTGWQEWTDKAIRDESGQVIEFQSVGRDVTERKMSEQALRESEEEFRALVTHLPNAAIYLDSPNPAIGTYYISPQIKQMLGYSPEEWVANPTTWSERIYPEDRERVLAADAHHDKSGEPFSQDYRLTTRDEKIVWVRDQGAMVFDDAGKPRFSLGIMIDMTERKRAEESLIQFKNVIDESNDAVFMIDPETGLYIDFNKKAYEFLGYSRDELSCLNIIDIALHIPDMSTWQERVALVRDTGSLIFESMYQRKDKTTFPVEVSTRMLDYDDREILIGIVRDITERKQAEAELQESEEHYRHLAQATVEGIAIGADGIFIDANPQCAQMFGYTLDEFLGMPMHSVVPPEDQERLAQILNSGREDITEQRVIRKDGTMRIAEVHSLPTVYKGQVARVAAVHDITERKQAEVALQQYADRLELLHEIDRSLLSARSSQEIAEGALNKIRQLIPCLRASVSLFDLDKEETSFLAADSDDKFDIPDSSITFEEFGQRVIDELRGNKPWFVHNVLQDVQATELDKRLANEHGIHTWLSLPLLSQGQLIGALNLGRGAGQPFTAKEAEFVREVADQIAIVIQQNRLFEETQRQMREQQLAEEKLRRQAEQMSVLYEIGLKITSKLDLDQILYDLFEKCRQLLPVDTFYIAVYDESSGLIQHPLFYDGKQKTLIHVDDRNIETAPGLSGHVILSKTTLYLPDSDDSRIQEKYGMVPTANIPSRSYVGVPMLFHGSIVGVISMHSFEANAYSPEQIRLLETIATQAAVAIENARLFQAERERHREADTLRKSLTSVVTLFELEEIVERILDQIKLVIPYDSASVWRVDGEWVTPIISRDIPLEVSVADLRFNVDSEYSSRPLLQGKKQFILNNDVQEELPDFTGVHSYINSWLSVPLRKRDKIIGLIALDGKRKGQFTQHHAELAVTFADQVAIALENASLYSEIQQELAERKRVEEALRHREELYRRSIEAAGAVPYYQDYLIDQYAFMGERIQDITGYSNKEMTPALWHAIEQETYMLGEGANLSEEEAIQKARAGQLKVWQSEVKFLTREGEVRWIADSAVELTNEQSEVIGSIGILQDITERKRAEQQIQQLNADLEKRVIERTAQLNEANRNIHQEKVRLEQYSRQRELMGTMTDLLQASLTTEEASGIVSRYMQLLFPNRDGALYLLNVSETLEPIAIWGEQKSLDTMFGMNDCWALRRGKPYRFGNGSPNPPCAHVGREIAQSALCIPLAAQGESMGSLHISTENIGEAGLIDDEEQRFIETITDSVALALANVRLRERLRSQSIRDGLTGLFNRRYLDETLPREIHRAERNKTPISVLMFDIDSFKKINDTYGHDTGDVVLKQLADLILSKVRPSDIACRYGGEEFTIIMPDTPLDVAHARAESLRAATAQMNVQHNGKDLDTITISLGVAAYPQHGITRDILIKSADEASYQAKKAGKNRVVVAE